jgi:hypothetical protein
VGSVITPFTPTDVLEVAFSASANACVLARPVDVVSKSSSVTKAGMTQSPGMVKIHINSLS